MACEHEIDVVIEKNEDGRRVCSLCGDDIQIELKCPHCKHNKFIRKNTEIVRVIEKGNSITDEFEGTVDSDTYECEKCHKKVAEEELVR